MNKTAPVTKPIPTAASLAFLVPIPVRSALRWRIPLDSRLHGGGECLMVSVGSGVPLTWLQLSVTPENLIELKLWKVVGAKGGGAKTVEIAATAVASDQVAQKLQQWAREFLAG